MDLKNLKKLVIDDNYLKDVEEIDWVNVRNKLDEALVSEIQASKEEVVKSIFEVGQTYKIVDMQHRLIYGDANVVFFGVTGYEFQADFVNVKGNSVAVSVKGDSGTQSFGLDVTTDDYIRFKYDQDLSFEDGKFGIHKCNDVTNAYLGQIYPAIAKSLVQLYQLNPESQVAQPEAEKK